MMSARVAIALLVALAGCTTPPVEPSPYADQLDSPVRGLSHQEITDFLEGNGAGFARAAELNGYPGPLHILELQEELGLTREEVAAFEALFDEMKGRAQAAGRVVVEAHEALEEAFRNGTVTVEELQGLAAQVDDAISAYRTVHLEYHVRARPMLSEHQTALYQQLRGYGQGMDHDAHDH